MCIVVGSEVDTPLKDSYFLLQIKMYLLLHVKIYLWLQVKIYSHWIWLYWPTLLTYMLCTGSVWGVSILLFKNLLDAKITQMSFSASPILTMTLKFLAWFMVRIHYEGKHINRNSTHHSNQHQQMEQTKFWLVLGILYVLERKKLRKKNKSQKQYKSGITSNRMNRNHVCVKLAEKQTNYLNLNWP